MLPVTAYYPPPGYTATPYLVASESPQLAPVSYDPVRLDAASDIDRITVSHQRSRETSRSSSRRRRGDFGTGEDIIDFTKDGSIPSSPLPSPRQGFSHSQLFSREDFSRGRGGRPPRPDNNNNQSRRDISRGECQASMSPKSASSRASSRNPMRNQVAETSSNTHLSLIRLPTNRSDGTSIGSLDNTSRVSQRSERSRRSSASNDQITIILHDDDDDGEDGEITFKTSKGIALRSFRQSADSGRRITLEFELPDRTTSGDKLISAIEGVTTSTQQEDEN
ncbi:uncharacterized protein L201_002627 [Kwoniella dendrophila CBS 6074]|uniref:Uncharacterized protein n=1 Tax=Kwoniella dendrophila CBS 6074 TaxID=1295534 RepID=A0AAX4JT18_9TREE